MWEGRELGNWLGHCKGEMPGANLPWVGWVFAAFSPALRFPAGHQGIGVAPSYFDSTD
jgi:hypothetical protein